MDRRSIALAAAVVLVAGAGLSTTPTALAQSEGESGRAAPLVGAAPTPPTRVVSLGADGALGDYDSGGRFVSTANRNEVDLSGNGRYVAFESEAGNLVGAADTNARTDVFVRDRDTDGDRVLDEPGATTTTIVSVGTDGVQQYGARSTSPSISRDGRFVAFYSAAALVADDTNGAGDVYVRDRDTDRDGVFDEPGAVATSRVSVGPNGEQGDNDSNNPEITPDGRFVSFASIATTLVPQDRDFSEDVYLRDRDTDGNGVFDEAGGVDTELISAPGSGPKELLTNTMASLTPDGRFVTWASTAHGWDPTDQNHAFDVYVRDRELATVVRLSVGRGGVDSNQESQEPVISDDGRWVVFSSQADNLVRNDTNEVRDIFAADRDPDRDGVFDEPGANRIKRVSVGYRGAQADAWSTGPSITPNGRVVVFESEASTIGLSSVHPDVYLRDRDADQDGVFDEKRASTTLLLPLSRKSGPPNGTSTTPAISANGRWVGFSSYAENLVPKMYRNGRVDVFVRGPFR